MDEAAGLLAAVAANELLLVGVADALAAGVADALPAALALTLADAEDVLLALGAFVVPLALLPPLLLEQLETASATVAAAAATDSPRRLWRRTCRVARGELSWAFSVM